jgi:AP-4 complex subunit epsilon-1
VCLVMAHWHIHAIRHARAMQVAYLASTLFLDSNSDLIVLIVNTITRDLADDNMLIGVHARLMCGGVAKPRAYVCTLPLPLPPQALRRCWSAVQHPTCALAVCTALTAVCKLINADLITAVLGPVLKLLEHPKELVRTASLGLSWQAVASSNAPAETASARS